MGLSWTKLVTLRSQLLLFRVPELLHPAAMYYLATVYRMGDAALGVEKDAIQAA